VIAEELSSAARLDATVASCLALINSRFPGDEDRGAAAMLLADGTILTGTSPDYWMTAFPDEIDPGWTS
jgi:hypothetical protein